MAALERPTQGHRDRYTGTLGATRHTDIETGRVTGTAKGVTGAGTKQIHPEEWGDGPEWLPPPPRKALDSRAGREGTAHSPPQNQAVGPGTGGCGPRAELCPQGPCHRCSCPQLQYSLLQREARRLVGREGNGGGGGTRSPTLLATLTLGSEEYSVTGLVAVGLAVMLGAGWG